MNLQPLDDRIVVRPGDAEETTASGLVLPDTAKEKPPQGEVLAAYRASDLFVLPCRVAADGDRDGLPNVLMEAQSQGLACLSTTVSAIPELIEEGVTGRLVPPDDVAALTEALSDLIGDPAQRLRLGAAGAARVREAFSHETGLRILTGLFGLDAPAEASGAVRAA